MRGSYQPPRFTASDRASGCNEWADANEEPNEPPADFSRRMQRTAILTFAGIGGLSVLGFAIVGIATVALPGAPAIAAARSYPGIKMLASSPPETPEVNGNCQCDHSSGSVCCCCSHCGCGANSPTSRRLPEATDDANENKNGGNWDIDVGGLGTAGGGYCQCNGQCCCCSSCDCSSSGPSMKHANITMSGPCSGIENCNGDLPARRQRALSERVRAQLDYKLLVHRQ